MRASTVRRFVEYIRRYHELSTRALLREAAIRSAQVAKPDGWISVKRTAELLDTAAMKTNNAALTMTFAAQLPWADYGVAAYVVLNSPTVGAALANACRYFALHSTGAGTQLVVEGQDAFVRYAMHDPTVVRHAQNTEMVFTVYVRAIRDGTGDPRWAPRAIHFKHEKPKNSSTQRDFFGCELLYGQAEDAIIVEPDELRRPMRRADAGLFPILVVHANAGLPHYLDRDVHDRARSIVASSLRTGDVSIEHVATELGTSERTLQRRLQDRGTSFKQLVADTRLSLARDYLADRGMSLTDAAYLLGYSELSAFSRAFRRWTGESALAFRRRVARRPPE
ncbi:MAG TPA: AraC family transcriptional regulator [Kofleriaceae bacterium]|nr:AraC family transcriptional regulator [Kofleriaceae bacterium]